MTVKSNGLLRRTAGTLLAAAFCVFGVVGAYAQPEGDSGDSGVTGAAAEKRPAEKRPAANWKLMSKADRLLAKQVRRALVRVKGLSADRIVVIARNGEVTLGGSVPDAQQIGVAVATAKGVSGVREVTDSLSVREPGQ